MVSSQISPLLRSTGCEYPRTPLRLRVDLERITKKLPAEGKAVQTCEVQVAAVEQIEGTRFGDQFVQDVDSCKACLR